MVYEDILETINVVINTSGLSDVIDRIEFLDKNPTWYLMPKNKEEIQNFMKTGNDNDIRAIMELHGKLYGVFDIDGVLPSVKKLIFDTIKSVDDPYLGSDVLHEALVGQNIGNYLKQLEKQDWHLIYTLYCLCLWYSIED